MHYEGHIGFGLTIYAFTFGSILVISPYPGISLLLVGVFALLPDVDSYTTLIEHRGPTHSVWFVLIVGILAYSVPIRFPIELIATIGVGSHVLIDAINPVGIRPFNPVSDYRFRIGGEEGVCEAGDERANRLLLGFGLLATGLATAFSIYLQWLA